ncbi:MAG: rhodanese-like domain-containing protein [Pseudomonadota bacterium]
MTENIVRKIWGWAVRGPSLVFALVLLHAVTAYADEDGLLSAPDAWQRYGDGELLIIDIRTQSEWRDTGIPEGAGRSSLFLSYGLPNLDFVDEVTALTGGDRSHPIALICAAGVRSAIAHVLLESEGFEQIYDIGEGMAGSGDGPGWVARGLPVEDCGDCSGS